MNDDIEILEKLARHLRKFELGCFDENDQLRAEGLIEEFIDTLKEKEEEAWDTTG